MPFNPLTGTWDYPTSGPGAKGTKIGGAHRGGATQRTNYLGGSLLPQERGREARAAGLAGTFDSALLDPEGTVGRFSDIYGQVGQALAAPAMRDFESSVARTGANVASRFGGNVSGEEQRQVYNTSDLFTRNLGEALARLGGEQVNAGLRYTGMLGEAAGGAASERDRLAQMIMSLLAQQGPAKSKNFFSQAGGLIGGAIQTASDKLMGSGGGG